MWNSQKGQAFLLVLIVLAIGALTVIPTLRLTSVVLNNTQNITLRNRGLYACGAAQEKIMWMLYHGDLMEQIPNNNDSISFNVDVCGTTVSACVIMRAVETSGGTILATDHTLMSTKTVEPNDVEDPGVNGIFTYTIEFEHVSINNTDLLTAVYDILPIDFGNNFGAVYRTGSSERSEDGVNWTSIPDPTFGTAGQQMRLEWIGESYFPSEFGHFEPGEIKYMRFEVNDTLSSDDTINCNRVITKKGDIYTVSEPNTIFVGDPDPADGCETVGVFTVTKTSDPAVIPPGVPTEVTYVVTITNEDGFTRHITQIDDYLPPGIEYTANSTSGLTTADPDTEYVTVNGVDRWQLTWDQNVMGGKVQIEAGANLTLTFVAQAVLGISGTYYNEVLVQPESLAEYKIYTDIDPELSIYELFGSMYSWNSGTIIVPAYDASTGAEGENVTSNIGIEPGGIRIISWN